MNWQYLQTFVWLRWRLRTNQAKRAGTGSIILQRILMALAILGAIIAFVVGFSIGVWALRSATPPILMLFWDFVIVAFLFVWMIELMVELQRSELMSLDKFLHLPVSLTGAFLINYLASILSPSTILFLPAVIGLATGMVISRGAVNLLLFPALAAFVLAVTAITYQFRGWLASLMINKRRRRTIIATATLIFILIFQIPSLLNFSGVFRRSRQRSDREVSREARLQQLDRTAITANLVVPVGWLPYGVRTSAEGRVAPSLLGAFGLALIGVASLARSYRTTLRLYTGQLSASKPRIAVLKKVRAPSVFLEKPLTWLPAHAAAIALAGFRSLTRAPEAKMTLLSPLIVVMVLGSVFMGQAANSSEFMRPLLASGAISVMLFTMIQLAGNQFGFDRSGFRAFVLSPASRKDILLGKNLAFLPFALGLGTIAISAMQFFHPMRIDHFLATLFQMISMTLVYCIITNFLSIFAPMPIASGSLKPANPKGMTILIQVGFMALMPLAMAPALIPLGIEFLLHWSGWLIPLPVYLLLAIIELLVIAYIYPIVLEVQGRILQSREQRILEIVTAKVE